MISDPRDLGEGIYDRYFIEPMDSTIEKMENFVKLITEEIDEMIKIKKRAEMVVGYLKGIRDSEK